MGGLTGFVLICGRVTLSPLEPATGHLPRKDGEPIFAEPWNAQALAMADLLIKSGRISPSDWASCLGAEIAAAHAAGHPDNSDTYYQAALSALEHLLVAQGRVSRQELEQRQEDWEHAYLATPHGKPVNLKHQPET